jgi:hypothetical protein
MLQDQLLQLKAQIEHEEKLYSTELKTTEGIETLKAIRLRISILKQQVSELDGITQIAGLPSVILFYSLCPN